MLNGNQCIAFGDLRTLYIQKICGNSRHIIYSIILFIKSLWFADVTIISAPSSPSNLSSVTLVGSTGSGSGSDPSPHGEATGRTYSRDISEDTDTSFGIEMQSNQGLSIYALTYGRFLNRFIFFFLKLEQVKVLNKEIILL